MRKIIVFAMIVVAVSAAAAAEAATEYKPDANAPRASVPDIYKWNLKDLFKSDGDWNSSYGNVSKMIERLAAYKGKLNTAQMLKKCTDDYFDVKLRLSRLSIYSQLKVAEDEDVEKHQKMFQRGQELEKKFNMGTSFIREHIMRMDASTLDAQLKDTGLSIYKEYIDEMRRRKSRLLGEEAEQVLGLFGDILFSATWTESDIEAIFKAALRDIALPVIKDEDNKDVQLTLANYSKYRASKDRRVRKDAVEGLFKALHAYQNIFSAALAGEMRRDVTLGRARKYDRTVDAYLDVDNIDPAVMENLISTVHRNLGTLHRYVNLRKKMLDIPDLHIYDLYTPLVKSVNSDVPYEEGIKEVEEALKPMGDEYVGILSRAMKPGSGWVDIYPNKGKESGAFSSGMWGVHPFNKLNYMDEIDDVFTLAHEMGHAMHSYLNEEAQPYFLSNYSTFIAEIASTFNETLLMEHLIRKYDEDSDILMYLLGTQIEDIRTTIFRQTLFAEFEKKIHEGAEAGTPLTSELFNKTYIDLVRKYYGPGFTVGENDDVEWAYIPHFYYKYYVYAYATGLSSGIALADKVAKEGAAARDKYIEMLKAPITAPPIETLRKAGADLTRPDAIQAACDLMDRSITEIERVMAKRKK